MEKEAAADTTTAKGLVHATGKGMKRVCTSLAPFLKVALAVGEKGSSVQQTLSTAMNLSLDTNSQSLRFIIQWTFSTYKSIIHFLHGF
jgi:hypothetical protein